MNRAQMDAHRAQGQTIAGLDRIAAPPVAITADDVLLAFRAGGCRGLVMHHETLVMGETPAGVNLRASVVGDAWRVRGTTSLHGRVIHIDLIDHEVRSLAALGQLVASVDRHARQLGVE